jgi:hypothetical protein
VRLNSRLLAASIICDSTMENAYTKIVASLVNAHQEHLNLAEALNVQVVGVLATLAWKNEGHRKKAGRILVSQPWRLICLF